MTNVQVVLVEDDEALGQAVLQAMRLEGYDAMLFGDARDALSALDADFPGVVVSDVRLPGLDGIAFFERLQQIDAKLPVIFTTGHGDVPMAVEMLKKGAADFFTKPYATDQLLRAVAAAAEKRTLVIENRRLRSALNARSESRIIGSSQAAETLRSVIAAVAGSNVDALVEGAEGTGKSFVARLLHETGPRARRPFVTIDRAMIAHQDAELLLFGRDPSAGLSRTGMIERANGGTLLLDDLTGVPGPIEARLLSLLENRTIHPQGAERPRKLDLTILATSSGTGFGLDHRMGAVRIVLPRLSARREDIPELFRHFVIDEERKIGSRAPDIGEAVWQHVMSHDWPGNLRELRAFARAFALGLSELTSGNPRSAGSGALSDIVAEFERTVLDEALRRAKGNVDAVAAKLSVPRKTLYDKLARHDLKPRDYR
ncbi:sigma-54-dependent transcriptional regulator [Parerythrobacter lacustris]|uniref:Sigma-54 dependent transcriptional regulator n=1 Tax=Parerythrobacter lacustris TaxID=2969984 RepID=A0ABT1XN23_9SPHN|nr:sigma-54 dependent transcriptional regulator [Parerythrobacter lacustris]MCR2833045.1 sigma-54 dependent transcriptional regulator [Parerythrobacter lacustris]